MNEEYKNPMAANEIPPNPISEATPSEPMAAPSEPVAAPIIASMPTIPPTPEAAAYAASTIAETSTEAASATPYTAEVYAAPRPAAPAKEASGEPFYTETIKNENRRRTGSKFKQAIAMAAIISILGGGSLGLGIGVGWPIANQYFIPRLMDDSAQVNAFRFDDSPALQAVGSFDGENVGYAALVASVEPSVVNISANVTRQQTYFNYSVPQEGTVAGSGILFMETDTKYYIVTNNHVTEGAQHVYVSIEGHDGVPASLVGKDARNDLAVISILKADVQKVGLQQVTLATFGDSDAMRMGDVVLAIGNALGEGNTATSGIVSADPKQVPIQGQPMTLLQTDAAINEGNSGGPLVNMNGEVIGINTAKLTGGASNSVEGMGYAIPSNVAKPIIEGLMQAKPMLGVEINNISEEMAQQFNLPQAGVIIRGLIQGAPAEKAGLQVSDIITGVNDAPVLTVEQLQNAIQQYGIGDTVQVKIIRDGKEFLTIPVKLAENDISAF